MDRLTLNNLLAASRLFGKKKNGKGRHFELAKGDYMFSVVAEEMHNNEKHVFAVPTVSFDMFEHNSPKRKYHRSD